MNVIRQHENNVATLQEFLIKSRKISRSLRKTRLAIEKQNAIRGGDTDTLDVFFEHAPCGTYPIVALRTVPCDLYIKGFCTPCSYSARAYRSGLGAEEIQNNALTQLDTLLENFDDYFVRRSNGRLDGYRLREDNGNPWYMLQLAGESSFFRDAEISPKTRVEILKKIIDFQEDQKVNFHLMLETRPEHLVSADRTGELERLAPLFEQLNVVINVGFEYRDEFLRNTFFAKNLGEGDFRASMDIARDLALDPGGFLFAGGYLLTSGGVMSAVGLRCMIYCHKTSLGTA